MTAECTQFFLGFHPLKQRQIRAQFDGEAIILNDWREPLSN
jgi:hypothetical protein